MADGKNIEIKIAATGGDQAATEIRKVDSAAEALVGGTSGKGLKALNEEAGKVTSSNVRMGTGMQNVGYQVQDLAVQIGSGTSAFRALGQQLPQLLSGFGPMGIALGTVSAIALPLAGAMFNLGDSVEDAGAKADEAAEKFKKLMDQRLARASAAGLVDNKAFIASLDDEVAAIGRVNTAHQTTIDLMRAKRRAQAEVDSAQAALELAKIDADDSLSDSDKIKARAKVQDGLERKKFEDRKADAGGRVDSANLQAGAAAGVAGQADAATETARQRLAAQEAETERLKAKVGDADAAKARLSGIDAKIAEKQKEQGAANNPSNLAGPQSDLARQMQAELNRKLQSELAALQKRRDETQSLADSATLKDREGLETLRGKKDDKTGEFKGGQIDDTKKAIVDLTVAAQKLAEAAAKAKDQAARVFDEETAGLAGDFEATKRRLEAQKITSDSGSSRAAAAARKVADEAAKRKSDDDERQRKLDERADVTKTRGEASRTRGEASAGRDAERLLPKGVSDAFAREVSRAAAGLQDGDQGGEMKKLIDLMSTLADATQVKGTETATKIAALEQKIAVLTGQVKNNRK